MAGWPTTDRSFEVAAGCTLLPPVDAVPPSVDDTEARNTGDVRVAVYDYPFGRRPRCGRPGGADGRLPPWGDAPRLRSTPGRVGQRRRKRRRGPAFGGLRCADPPYQDRSGLRPPASSPARTRASRRPSRPRRPGCGRSPGCTSACAGSGRRCCRGGRAACSGAPSRSGRSAPKWSPLRIVATKSAAWNVSIASQGLPPLRVVRTILDQLVVGVVDLVVAELPSESAPLSP